VARRAGRVKKRSMSSNSPRSGMVAADYRRRPVGVAIGGTSGSLGDADLQ
jgi:hypothetical protein